MRLTGKKAERYLRRSYTAVDGLWFVKVEEKFGFRTALTIDREVWKVMPKIQARTLAALAGVKDRNIRTLASCFAEKLMMDGFTFTSKREKDGFSVSVTACPWFEALRKSGRERVAGRIGSAICTTEYGVWAAEFNNAAEFGLVSQICKGDRRCLFKFRSRKTFKRNEI